MLAWLLPTIALAVSVSTAVLSQVNFRHTARKDYVAELEKRVDNLEKALAACEAKSAALKAEVDMLLRRIARMPEILA